MSDSFDAQQWVEDMGGTLHDGDMLTMWCHQDSRPSGKLYREGRTRAHCFACNKTFWPEHLQIEQPRVTLEMYNRYQAKHGGWSTLQEVLDEIQTNNRNR